MRMKSPAPVSMTSPMAATPQAGASTHHHDQSMTPVSFRTMKVMQSRPGKPMLGLDTRTLLAMMFLSLVSVLGLCAAVLSSWLCGGPFGQLGSTSNVVLSRASRIRAISTSV